jgi:hypothetical protein
MDKIVLAYVGPETVLPVASALAAVAGAFLVCGRFLKRGVQRCFRFIARR